jgi:type IV pilus assembly protein PilB
MDFRVSVLPTIWGEKIVLRLLDKSNLQLDMTKLGFDRRRSATSSGRSTSPTAWCSSPARPARARRRRSTRRSPSSTSRRQHQHRRRSGRVQPARHQPGADARRHRPQLRGRPALVPAPGPRHHHGRRDPRLRDRRDRGQGRAHRPPGALDAAHQRRAEHVSRLLNMGVEPFLVTASRQPRARAAPRARICADCKAEIPESTPGAARLGFTEEQLRKGAAHEGRGLRPATAPATRAASRSTRSCASPRPQGDGAPGRLDRRAQAAAIGTGGMPHCA